MTQERWRRRWRDADAPLRPLRHAYTILSPPVSHSCFYLHLLNPRLVRLRAAKAPACHTHGHTSPCTWHPSLGADSLAC